MGFKFFSSLQTSLPSLSHNNIADKRAEKKSFTNGIFLDQRHALKNFSFWFILTFFMINYCLVRSRSKQLFGYYLLDSVGEWNFIWYINIQNLLTKWENCIEYVSEWHELKSVILIVWQFHFIYFFDEITKILITVLI